MAKPLNSEGTPFLDTSDDGLEAALAVAFGPKPETAPLGERERAGDSLAAPRPTKEMEALGLPSHYQVVGEVGRGSMGVVYLARDASIGRDVAVKALRQKYA